MYYLLRVDRTKNVKININRPVRLAGIADDRYDFKVPMTIKYNNIVCGPLFIYFFKP